MSKQKRRQKRRFKQLVKRLHACKACAYLAATTDLIRARQSLANATMQCPQCGRELLVPMRPDDVGQDIFEKSLRAAGELMRDPALPAPTHFQVFLNDERLFEDPGVENAGEDDVVCVVNFQIPPEDFDEFKLSKQKTV